MASGARSIKRRAVAHAHELILHHYPVSPFAEKARAMLGFKRLAWRSVTVPVVMPKPDLLALTGGYRRTPVLQIGADVYCDTALIARVLERRQPRPALFPRVDTFAALAMAHYGDSVLFNITVPVTFQPGGMLARFVPGGTDPNFVEKFAADRAALRAGGTVRRGPPAECRANLAHVLPRVEAELATRPFLLGERACIADFSLYMALWPVRQVTPELLERFPRTSAFVERVAAFGHGSASERTAAEALDIARAATPAAIAADEAAATLETGGAPLRLGGSVRVMPVDSGFDPVEGELVLCSAEEVAVRRTDPRAGTVVVHFPRLGYQVLPA
jgi:glutathione S-transferase